jgi:2-keto-3-deoxy-L-rhamnonate aldolase RhmA
MRFQFKQRLAGGKPQRGTFVFSSDPAMTEIVGRAGFDFVIVDREHTALGWREVEAHARAARAAGIAILVRVQAPDGVEVSHALDLGADGVVIPHFGLDPGASAACVKAARYAPAGERGTCTGTRANSYSLDAFAKTVEEANEGAAVVVQIEDAAVLDGLDELLAQVPVDAAMPGLADLATSLCHPGGFSHPEVLAAADRMFASVKRARLPLGFYIANPGEVARWAGREAAFHVFSIDYKVVAEGYRAAAETLQASG